MKRKLSELPQAIQDGIHDGRTAYDNVINGSIDYITVDINCSELPDPIWVKGRDMPPAVYPLFENIPQKQSPCLYYFEIIEGDHQLVLDTYTQYRKNPIPWRAVATLKKSPPVHSSTLYVGKVKSDIYGRFVVHLGYYYVQRTAGLQLVSWCRKIGLKLRLHIYAFPAEMQSYISALELNFARSLVPMIGKH
jgi:hypothetical protein